MPRQLTASDLLITRIEGENYGYIKPEIGSFNATRTIENFSFSGGGQFGRLLLGAGNVEVEKATVTSAKIGLKVFNDVDARVIDYQFRDTVSDTRFSVGIRIDENHTGSAEFLRLYGNGLDDPSQPVKDLSSNTDFLTLNNTKDNAGTVYIRDMTSKNFSDSGIDVKNDIFIMNATITDSFRALKVYNGATVTIVNSKIESGPTGELIKLFGPESKVRFYNTTWDGKDKPDFSKIGFADVPHHMQGSVYRNNVVELKSNPLPAIDDFFTIDNAQYKAQLSVNGGPWIDLKLPNNGYLSTAVGDTLIDLPELGPGAYRLRAWTVENGKATAAVTSATFTVKNGGLVAQTDGDRTSGATPSPDAEPDAPTVDRSIDKVESGARTSSGGFTLVAGKGDQLLITSAGGDVITTGFGDDLILFDTREDVGDDVFTDFNRGRDKLLFTEFVDLGADGVHQLDSRGRFNLDDASLDANGGTIALSPSLAGRFIHYAGATEDGLHVYEMWNSPWSAIGG